MGDLALSTDHIIITRKNMWLFWDGSTWVADIDSALGFCTYGAAARAMYAIPHELIIGNTTVGPREATREAIQEIG